MLNSRADNSPNYIREIADTIKRIYDWLRPSPVAISANYTVTIKNTFVVVDAAGGNITITLPDAKDFNRDTVTIVRKDASVNTVTIAAADTVNGAASITIANNYTRKDFVSTGTAWIGG